MSGVGMLSHAQCVGYLLCSGGKWDIGSGFQLYILHIGVRTILHLQSISVGMDVRIRSYKATN